MIYLPSRFTVNFSVRRYNKETVSLDNKLNSDFFGAGVEGLEAGKLNAFSYQDQLVFW